MHGGQLTLEAYYLGGSVRHLSIYQPGSPRERLYKVEGVLPAIHLAVVLPFHCLVLFSKHHLKAYYVPGPL